MPELPEVETVVRGLRAPLIGRSITGVSVAWPRTIARPSVDDLVARVVGRRITLVGRRGKYLIIGLDQGYLLIHLKMSGRLQVVPAAHPPDKHVRVLFDLDNGQQLRFQDVRKFGRLYAVDDPAEVTVGLGPEPLADDFTLDEFCHLLSRRSGRLKSLLLNQQFLAGLGNIYADEVLFSARLHPLRKASSLTRDEQDRLYRAIRTVLGHAVASRGTTLDDRGYVDALGQPGMYQEQLAVYGRQGEPCHRCQLPIERIIIGGRSAHFCPGCQVERMERSAGS
jgi:formamidopyrimidine-DNA glycosylase